MQRFHSFHVRKRPHFLLSALHMAEELPAGVAARRDYNAEGRKLIASLGVGDRTCSSPYNDLDPVYKDPETGGMIFVGNESAARGPVSKLLGLTITHVVNCMCQAGLVLQPLMHPHHCSNATFCPRRLAMLLLIACRHR